MLNDRFVVAADLCRVTVWPLFESPLNGLPGAEFSTVQSQCDRRNKDREACRWKISTCIKLEVLSEKAECVPGSEAQGSGFYLRGHCDKRQSKHIWCRNLQNPRCCDLYRLNSNFHYNFTAFEQASFLNCIIYFYFVSYSTTLECFLIVERWFRAEKPGPSSTWLL